MSQGLFSSDQRGKGEISDKVFSELSHCKTYLERGCQSEFVHWKNRMISRSAEVRYFRSFALSACKQDYVLRYHNNTQYLEKI